VAEFVTYLHGFYLLFVIWRGISILISSTFEILAHQWIFGSQDDPRFVQQGLLTEPLLVVASSSSSHLSTHNLFPTMMITRYICASLSLMAPLVLGQSMTCDLDCANGGVCVFESADFSGHPKIDGKPLGFHEVTNSDGMSCKCPDSETAGVGLTGLLCDVRFVICEKDKSVYCYQDGSCAEGVLASTGMEVIFCECRNALDFNAEKWDGIYCNEKVGTPTVSPTSTSVPFSKQPTAGPSQNSGSPGLFGCFPGDSTVQVEGGDFVAIKDLKLGDRVKVSENKFEPVYSFAHKNSNMVTSYLQLRIASGSRLTISPEHLLFVHGHGAVPASHVKTGDQVYTGDNVLDAVVSVKSVIKKGVYAPFTPSGELIVNNVLVSSFIAYGDSPIFRIAGYSTGISFQWLGHTFELPHRVWCTYLSSCENETYSFEGISSWVDLPHRFAHWWFNQNIFVMMALFVPFLVYMVVLGVVQWALTNPFVVTSIMLLVTTLYTLQFSYCQTKTKKVICQS
jgi:hypothetical protein